MTVLPFTFWVICCACLIEVRPTPAHGEPTAVAPASTDNARPRPSLREVWVPAENLAPILGRYPRAVALSRDELFSLWRDAHADDAATQDFDQLPPVRVLIRQAKFEGRLATGPGGQTQVRVEGKLEVDSLSDAWTELSLGLQGIALGTVEADEASGNATVGLQRVGGKNEGPASVEIQGRGVHRLRVGFVLPVRMGPDGSSVVLPTLTGVGEFVLHLPTGARADSPGGCVVQPDADGVVARVALRHAPQVPAVNPTAIRDFAKPDRAAFQPPLTEPDRLHWRTPPPAPPETGALLQAGRTEATIGEASVTIRQEVRLCAAYGQLAGEARFALPAGASAVRVEGSGLGPWGLGADGLHVAIARDGESDGTVTFTVDYLLALPFDPKGSVRFELPVLEAAGAHRLTGAIAVKRSPEITVQRIEPGPAAVPAVPGVLAHAEETAPGFVAGFALADLPAANNSTPLAALRLDARRNVTRFSVDADARADFQLDGVRIARTLTFHVEEGEMFTEQIVLPAGETVSTVHATDGGKEPDWRQEGSGLRLSWTTGLPESSKIALIIDSRAELVAPKPGAPTEFLLGAALVPGAERLTGYVALASVPAFRLVTTGGEERLERRDGRSTPVSGGVAWFYRDDFRLALRVERRLAETEARFTGDALPLAGAVEIHAQIDYRFLYSGVEMVKVRVPREWADAFFFTGEHIAERRRDDDVWTIRFQGERSGDYTLGVQATIPTPADQDDAQRFHFRLPAIVPLEGARWSGTWAVEANTDTEIRFAVTGANEMDTLHAPPLPGYQPRRRVIGVFEFLGGTANTGIDLDGVRHPAAGGAAAVVDRLDLETDASTSGVMRHRATVRARTVGDGFFNVRLPPGATLWSLTLDGAPVKPVRGAGAADEVRVELPGGKSPVEASRIVLVYETAGQLWHGAGWRTAVAPTFDDGVPVLHRHWRLSVPAGFEYRFADTPSDDPSSGHASGDLLISRIGTAVGHVAQWVCYYPWFGGEVNKSTLPRWMAAEIWKRDARKHAGEAPMEMALEEPVAANESAVKIDLPDANEKPGDAKGYPETRGRVLHPAVNSWEMPVRRGKLDADPRRNLQKINDDPGTVVITRKLQSIIIPNVEFRQTMLNDAVEFLRQEARRLDPDPDESNKGVNIFLKLPSSPSRASDAAILGLPPGAENAPQTAFPVATGQTRISLTLSHIPLLAVLDYVAQAANLKIKVEPYAVSLVPLNEQTEAMVTTEVRVPSGAFAIPTDNVSPTSSTRGATDVTGAGSSTRTTQADVRSFLESSGITFPPGSSAVHLASINKLVMRNTQANIDLLASLLSSAGEPNPLPGLTMLDGRESPKGVAGLLPLRLDLPTNGVPYEFDGGKLAALEFHYTDWTVAARWRWIFLTLGALAFLCGAAGWAHPWRRTLYAVLALTFFPLIVAPAATVACNALLAGWLWALAGWCVTRFLLRRRRFSAVILLVGAAVACAFTPVGAAPGPLPSSAPSPELVIVPYDATKPVAGQTPGAYYLPYERFLLLWDAAKRHRRPPAPEPPPGGERYMLGAARYDARLDGATLVVDATLDLQTFGEDWVGVPLHFDPNRVQTVTLDGAPAALGGDGVLWIGKPGGHRVGVSLRIPAADVTAGTRLSWSVPPTAATLVTLVLPRAEFCAEIRGSIPEGDEVEETIPEGRRLTASLGGTSTVELTFRDAPAPAPTADRPALASVDGRQTTSARQESVDAEFRFSFPGNTLDHFTVLLDRSLTLTGLDAPDVGQWRLTTGGDRQTLDIVLNAPARDDYRLSLTADRPVGPLPATRRVFPLVSALAMRVEQTAALLTEGAVELSLPDGVPAGMRRVSARAPAQDHVFAAFAGDAREAVVYSVRGATAKRTAHINYLYQVGRNKIELAASLRLLPAAGEPLVTTDLRLPAGFEAQAVVGEAVQQWWRDGDVLALRFRPGSGQVEVPLLVYLVRQFERAPERFVLQPLVAAGFASTEGETLVAADGSYKVGLTLPVGVRAAELGEIGAATAAREFEVKPPLERQRAFRYHGAQFEVAATLETQPARRQTQWVTHATVRDGTLALETHVNVTMLQGAVDALEFSLPSGLNEARVSGPDVRETVASGPGGERRTYRVLFQNALYAGVETGFTINLELPLDANNRAALPDLVFPGAGEREAGGFVLVENASSGEMSLEPHGLEPAIEKDVPFLPPSIVAGTRFYRVTPGAPWSLGVRVTPLEKTAGRAALVAYAELTTTLRSNGEEWHRATYRLQNRRLQFLPVELPPGMELIGARVAGESVRVDAGPGETADTPTLLVPLVRTRPGELSYDVELIYRRPVPEQSADRSKSALTHWELQDPRLPGIPVEKTLWDVYLPTNARLLSAGGNLEPVVAAVSSTEKLESALSDLRELSATYRSSGTSDTVRRRALDNYNSLAAQVTQQAKAKSPGRESMDKEVQGALFKKPDVASQNAAVSQRQQTILDSIYSLNASNATADQGRSQDFSGRGTVANTRQFTGRIDYGSPVDPALGFSGTVGGQVWRDNRLAEVQPSAGNTKVDAAVPRADAQIGRDIVVLNDSVTLNLPAKDADLAASQKRLEPSKDESALRLDNASQFEKRLSTARANSANIAPATPNVMPPAVSAPAPPPVLSTPRPVAQPAGPNTASDRLATDEVPHETLRSEGHISLAVDFPLEGQVYHFKKIKADARLTLWSAQPESFIRLAWLGVLLIVLAVQWTARRMGWRWFRSAPGAVRVRRPVSTASIG